MVSYGHADKSDNCAYDKRNYRGGVHPFSAAREQVCADLGCIRMLEAEVSAELLRTVQHGAGASVREVSSALVAAARKHGLFVPYENRLTYGDLKRRRSGESEVYVSRKDDVLVKFKDPEAKQPLKRTTASDWLYEHIIHNVLFPESRYEFIGISEVVGSVRIVLRQKNINAISRPDDAEIATELEGMGLLLEDRYFYGNEALAVTDVSASSDNVLRGNDGRNYYIDPLIRLKRPARQVLDWMVGELD